MAAHNIEIIITVDTRPARKAIALLLRSMMSAFFGWRRFFRLDYWRTWKTTICIFLDRN